MTQPTAGSPEAAVLDTGAAFSIRRLAARHETLALVDQGVVSLKNFLASIIIARACTREQFGLYVLGLTIVALLVDLQASLISTPYTVYGPRLGRADHARYTGSTFIHQLALALIAIVAMLAASGVLALTRARDADVATVLMVLAVILLAPLMQDYLRRLSFAVLELKAAVIADIAVAVVQVGLLSMVAIQAPITPTTAYGVLAVASLAGVLSWRAASRVRFHFSLGHAATDLRLALRTGKWILVSGVLWTLGMNLYPWLLASFHGTAATATWAACFAAAAFAGPVITGIGNVVGPRLSFSLATGGTTALRRATLRSAYLLGAAMLPFVIGAALFGSRIVALAYGDKYAGSGAVVLLLIANSFFTAVGLPYSRGLFAIERADLDVVSNLVALAVTVSAGIWLVRSFGVIGAALSLAVGGLGACGARVFLFTRFVRKL